MATSKHHRRPGTIAVYKRLENGQLAFTGWATTKQSLAEVAGRHLPLKVNLWRRATWAGAKLVVEYYMPSIDEQAAWNGRPRQDLSEAEVKRLSDVVSARDMKVLEGESTPAELRRQFWAKIKFRFRTRVQPHIAHRELGYGT